MPFVRPVTVQLRPAVVHVKPPGDEVAVYDVIAEPFAAAADHVSVALPLPAAACDRVGAPGSPAGVADSAFEAAPVPTPFVAFTVKEYDVPFARPVTEQLSPDVVHVKPPGDEVAVYDEIAEPFAAAADQASVALPLPGVAVFSVGAPGSVAGVADSAFEAGPVPAEFVAVTVNE